MKQGNGTGQLVAARYGKDVYFNLKNSSLAAINGTGVVFDDHTVELANSTQKAQQTNLTKNGWRIYENRLFWRGQHTWRACPLPRTNTTYTLSTKKCKDGEKVKLRVSKLVVEKIGPVIVQSSLKYPMFNAMYEKRKTR